MRLRGEDMSDNDKGIYLVAESIDCGGKGSLIDGIKEHLVQQGKNIIDLRLLWPTIVKEKVPAAKGNLLWEIYGKDDVCPAFKDISSAVNNLDAIFVCEPTWEGLGLVIRHKAVHEVLGEDYGPKDTADLYARNRATLLEKLIIPARAAGVSIFSERNVVSSLVYQATMNDGSLSMYEIADLEGNALALNSSPDVYAICDVDPETAMQRKTLREKKDYCKFETVEFQQKIHEKYQSEWLMKFLEKHGSSVVYVNANDPRTAENTKHAGVEILIQHAHGVLKSGDRFLY